MQKTKIKYKTIDIYPLVKINTLYHKLKDHQEINVAISSAEMECISHKIPIGYGYCVISGYFENYNKTTKPKTIIDGYLNERKKLIEYYFEGLRHYDDGPAFIYYNNYDNISYSEYFKMGVPHRVDGPCVDDGLTAIYSDYMINGKLLPNHFPRYYNDKIINNIKLTKDVIIKALLFDREYGKFLKEQYEKKNI